MRPIDHCLKDLSQEARSHIYHRFGRPLETRPDHAFAKELIRAKLMTQEGGAFFYQSGRKRYVPTDKGKEAFQALHDKSHDRMLSQARRRAQDSEREMERLSIHGMF